MYDVGGWGAWLRNTAAADKEKQQIGLRTTQTVTPVYILECLVKPIIKINH
jgi:hypothetical protein